MEAIIVLFLSTLILLLQVLLPLLQLFPLLRDFVETVLEHRLLTDLPLFIDFLRLFLLFSVIIDANVSIFIGPRILLSLLLI